MTGAQLLDWAHVAALLTAYAGLAFGIYKGLRVIAGPTLHAIARGRTAAPPSQTSGARPLASELA